jgi:ATPase subunit of ABC transporter with duplicated ATPase domains
MLRIENLTYRIGSRVLFDQASASVNSGHRVGLVGRNGAGKTTLSACSSAPSRPTAASSKSRYDGRSA